VQLLLRGLDAVTIADATGLTLMTVQRALDGRWVPWDVAAAILTTIRSAPVDVALGQLVADVAPDIAS
jgi:hypothetical protein